MARKKVSDMTAQELEQHRVYMRKKKAESRARMGPPKGKKGMQNRLGKFKEDEKRDVRLNIKVTQTDHSALTQAADSLGASQADVVIDALNLHPEIKKIKNIEKGD